ncbi:hypothetical protein HYW54_04360 [Candidatus Gottesmanbacteria bacterium]|nr:hypothetical protein [Candidatus Gottesmanbacteria bacterium]
MKRKIRVGFDFDGVIAYNPFRVIRYPLWYFKKNILGMEKLSFWYPKHPWQQIFWKILHESSIIPANGVDLLRALVSEGKVEAHLVTARYSFLDERLTKWLKKHNLDNLFTSITNNKNDEQPHLFKERVVRMGNFDYYIEDNLDIVFHLDKRVKTEVFWIYNLFDRFLYRYKNQFPHLKKALEAIMQKR